MKAKNLNVNNMKDEATNGVDFEMQELLFQERRNACIKRIEQGFKEISEKYKLTDEEKQEDEQELNKRSNEWSKFQQQRQIDKNNLKG